MILLRQHLIKYFKKNYFVNLEYNMKKLHNDKVLVKIGR